MGRVSNPKSRPDYETSAAVMLRQPSAPLAYTIANAVHASGFSRTRIYQLAAEGKLTLRRAGGRTIVLANELENYIRNLPPALIRQRDA